MVTVTPMKLYSVKYTLNYEELSASATSKVVYFHTPGDADHLLYLNARVTTAFAGVTDPYVKLGATNHTDMIIEDQLIDKVTSLKLGTRFGQDGFCPALTLPKGALQEQALYLTFGSASGNLSSLTAGVIEFVMVYVVPE